MKCCFDLSCCIQGIVSQGLPSSFNHIEVASGQDPGWTEKIKLRLFSKKWNDFTGHLYSSTSYYEKGIKQYDKLLHVNEVLL